LKEVCDKIDENAIAQYHDDELYIWNLSVSVFTIGYDEYFPSPQMIIPEEKADCNNSLSSTYRNKLRSLSRQFNFDYYYLQNETSTANNHIEENQKKASSKYRTQDTLRH
jgi:hypothetical protein